MNHLELTGHLTDEQFVECLDQPPFRPEVEKHLLECETCRVELKKFETSMSEFSAATWDWSQSRPVVSLREKAAETRPVWIGPPVQWAMAALLLIGIGVSGYRFPQVQDRRADSAVAEQSGDSEAQIKEDNALLQSVNVALGKSDLSPIEEYGITLKPETRATHRAPRIQ